MSGLGFWKRWIKLSLITHLLDFLALGIVKWEYVWDQIVKLYVQSSSVNILFMNVLSIQEAICTIFPMLAGLFI